MNQHGENLVNTVHFVPYLDDLRAKKLAIMQ